MFLSILALLQSFGVHCASQLNNTPPPRPKAVIRPSKKDGMNIATHLSCTVDNTADFDEFPSESVCGTPEFLPVLREKLILYG